MKTPSWNDHKLGSLATVSKAGVALAATVIGAWLSIVGAAEVSAQTYYVSPSGSDSNSGLSTTTPFRTVARAASVAQAGATVYLRAGTYQEYLAFGNSGTSSARITFEGYPGETPVIDGSHIATNVAGVWSQPPLIRITGSYVTLRRIEVKNAAADGIYVTGSNVIMDALHIHHTYLSGIRLFSAWDGTVSNSTIHDVYDWGSGGNDADCISASWYVPHGRHTIRNNHIYNCSDDGIDMWTSTDNLLEGNVIHHAGYPGNGNGTGFKLGSAASPYGGRNIVRNNIIYDCRSWGIGSAEGPDNQVYNNTAFRNGSGNYANWGKPGVFRNNIGYQGGNSLSLVTGGNNSWDLGITDPQFMSTEPTSPDFLHLRAGSPAIDRGAITGMAYVGTAPDLGAYEFGSTGSGGGGSTPPPTTDTTAPSVPSGLTGTAVSSTQINLSWTASTDNVGVVGYQVYQNGAQVGTASGTTYTRTGLSASTTYSFTVVAYDASGNVSGQSAAASVTTQAAAPPPPSGGASCPSLTPLNVAGAWSDGGVAWAINGTYGTPADVTPTASTSLLRLYENSTALGPAHTLHAEIRSTGQGRYSHYSASDGSGESIRFAASDNSDPRSNGRAYAYCVASAGGSGGGGTTTPPADTAAPSVPSGLSATATSQTQINLAWSASTDNVGVVGYRVYRGGSQVATTTTPAYSNTGLTAGTSYSFTVAAYDAAGNVSSQSGAASATTQAAPDTAAPSVPGGVSATVVSQTQVNLAWTAATDNVSVSGYRVYQSGTQIGTSPTPSYSVTGLTAGTSYSFTVAAYDAAGNVSSQSGAASATTQAAPDTAAPTVPGSLSATAVSQTQINLAWNVSTDNVGVVGYKVFQNGSQVATTTTAGYSQTGLTAGTSYSFTVSAYDAAGNTSGVSAVANATTQSPPAPPAPSPTAARTIELSPSNADTTCSEEFEITANTLRAGDTLVLHGGTYSQSCARVLSNLHGTAQQPIVIRAATGETPVLTRPVRPNGDYDQNNLEIADSSYVTIQGLVFRGGEIGVRLTGTNHHLTIENSEIADTGNAGFTANSGDTDALILRHNQIHRTGRFTLAVTEGEGIYLGCNGATCRVTNSVIEQNYIHDLRGTSSGGNDGIEVKVGSGGNIVRHNVIHTTTVGTAYPCILVYGGGANPNTVEGNVVWQCGEAIVAVADATVRNNIVLQSNTGLASYPHEQVAVLQNVSFINNTVYGHAECASLRWTGAINMVLANNALYCAGQVAIYAPGLVAPGAQATSNYVEGALVGVGIDDTRFLAGGTAAGTFANPAALDFWPQAGSLLRNTANLAYLPSADFNGLPRSPSRDVGAYATKGFAQNVGWRITPGFKVLSGDSTAPTKPRGLRVR